METIIEFHRDLQSYTDTQIHTMAKHTGLSGRPDDLRWMLAIQNSHVKAHMPLQLPALEAMVDGGMTLKELLNLRRISREHRNAVNKYLPLLVPRLKSVDSETLINLIHKSRLTPTDLVIVKGLLKNPRVDPTVHNDYPIRRASRNGHLEVVRLLLADLRADPSANHNYAIQVASQYGHLEVVRLLLADSFVDPTDNNNYAIRWASRNGHTDIVNLLLQDPRVASTYNA